MTKPYQGCNGDRPWLLDRGRREWDALEVHVRNSNQISNRD